jgi:hypothetical protein
MRRDPAEAESAEPCDYCEGFYIPGGHEEGCEDEGVDDLDRAEQNRRDKGERQFEARREERGFDD